MARTDVQCMIAQFEWIKKKFLALVAIQPLLVSTTKVHHAICINHTIAFTLFKSCDAINGFGHTLNRFTKALFHALFAPNFYKTAVEYLYRAYYFSRCCGGLCFFWCFYSIRIICHRISFHMHNCMEQLMINDTKSSELWKLK